MPGTPRGAHFTEDFPNSRSAGLIALIFAAAQGWKGGFSSGVTLGSNCLRASKSAVGVPLNASSGATNSKSMPAPLGNHTPEKSGCPSAARGGGPPGGNAWTRSGGFCFCANIGRKATHRTTSKLPPVLPRQLPNHRFISNSPQVTLKQRQKKQCPLKSGLSDDSLNRCG